MRNATTASRAVLVAVIRARTAEIAAAWPRAARGEPRAIHRARTASRRLRELLPIVEAAAPEAGARRLRRETRRLTRALGPARELDVAIDVLAGEVAGQPEIGAGIAAIMNALETERDQARDALRTRLEELDIDLWRARGDGVLDAVTRGSSNKRERAALAKRLRRRAVRVMTLMATAGTLYSADALHRVRLAVKKLRYALELARDLTAAPVDASIAAVKAAQDKLGRIHDLHVLDQFVRAMQPPSGHRAAANGSVQLLSSIERESREQHAAYLALREDLHAVARQAAHPVAAILTGRKQPARMKLGRRSRRGLRLVVGGR